MIHYYLKLNYYKKKKNNFIIKINLLIKIIKNLK